MDHLTPAQQKELTEELERQLQRLERSMRVSDEASRTVELDQTAVGRLSRMDSLQNQSMTKSLQERERVKLALLQGALRRLAEGAYGVCTECGTAVPFDPG